MTSPVCEQQASRRRRPPPRLTGGGLTAHQGGALLHVRTARHRPAQPQRTRRHAHPLVADRRLLDPEPSAGQRRAQNFGRPLFAETTFDGTEFGLGSSVLLDNAENKVLSSTGSYSWGGAASTVFWVDPAEEIVGLFLTQLLPSDTYPIRSPARSTHTPVVRLPERCRPQRCRQPGTVAMTNGRHRCEPG